MTSHEADQIRSDEGIAEVKARIGIALAASVGAVALSLPASAQSDGNEQQASARRFDIPAGALKAALDAFIRQSRRQVIYRADDFAQARSRGAHGSMTDAEALEALLAGSGFVARFDASGAIAIVRSERAGSEMGGDSESQVTAGLPDILVTGRRDWNLNVDIRRTRDDAQPYVVFNREQIERSGATNIEDFFRTFLNANTNPTTSGQNGGRGLSSVNLRGLGSDETLILVDGRRLAPVNTGNGDLRQPSITGIPMAAIDRIEVLASSASAIYGSNATGGVVNIILKRDYSGLEATASYGGTYDGGAEDKRIDISSGVNLEGGRTNIMFSGSWDKRGPLYVGQRDLTQHGLTRILANNPNYFAETTTPPLGATPNISSVDGSPLMLLPQYGGQSIGSSYTYVPSGYLGIAQSGVGPLVTNAGQYNLALSQTAVQSTLGSGAKYAFLSPQETLSGTLAVRREFNSWLKTFVEIAGSQDEGSRLVNLGGSFVTLAPGAPNNPFQQAINVTFPLVGADREDSYKNQSLRLTGGLIFTLPAKWQASLEYSWNRTWSSHKGAPGLTTSMNEGMADGTVDVLRDPSASPVDYQYVAFADQGTHLQTTTATATFRLAGPVPIKLFPGGKPTLSMVGEHSKTILPDSIQISNSSLLGSAIVYSPARHQTMDSAYIELRLPIFAEANRVPLLRGLELQIAGRYERYMLVGALSNIDCADNLQALPSGGIEALCPPSGTTVETARNSRATFNPTFSVKWQPARDLTLRGSYATGYRPPDVSQLVRQYSNQILLLQTDPLRGDGPIGIPLVPGISLVSGYTGGNPNLRPEKSKSYSAGAILTPRFLPGLRLSADWTRIVKRNNYFDPLLLALDPLKAAAFRDFLNLYPGRVTRSGDPGTFPVAPITAIDLSLANMSGETVGAVDLAGSYSHAVAGGTLDISVDATWEYDLTVKISPNLASIQYAGSSNLGSFFGGSEGALEWKGNATIRYDRSNWSIGGRVRYYDGYWLQTDHLVDPMLGQARVPAQAYVDLFGSYKVFRNTELRFVINNLFNKRPPPDHSVDLYSLVGDPRLGNFFLSLTQKF